MKLTALGRLLRLSLAPSAAADVAAGLLLAHGGAFPQPRAWLLIPAALGVFHGALALNDWADRQRDRDARPQRPLPSGALRAASALVLGVLLTLAGIALAFAAAPQSALWLGAIAALAVFYDLAGRGPWRGPLLLGACRAANLGSGAVWALPAGTAALPAASLAAPCLLYGLHVFWIARLGRMEDAEDAREPRARPRALLLAAALPLLSVPWLQLPANLLERAPAALLALLGAARLAREALSRRSWTRAQVERSMGLALRGLLLFSAAVALLPWRAGDWRAPLIAAAILLGYPLSRALRGRFPPS